MRLDPGLAMVLLFALGGGTAAAETVVLRREDCLRLSRHLPDPDVAYRPGIDAKGRPVAPAGLADPAADAALPPEAVIALQLPLDDAMPQPPLGLGQSEVTVGTVGVDLQDGTVWLNGRRIGQDAVPAVREACRRALGR